MGVVVAGIDEAGYGPMLGPLCVATAAIEVDHAEADRWPDLWADLRAAVTREPGEALRRGLVAVGDSKRLKLPNQSRTRHPLTHLERGVLAFARSLWDEEFADDAALLGRLGATLEGPAWYGGPPRPLPVSTTADHIRVLAATLAGAMASAGVRLVDLRCELVCEGRFNELYADRGTKSAVEWSLVSRLLGRTLASSAAAGAVPPRVMVDRQGGRRSYAGALRTVPGAEEAATVSETEVASVYDLRAGDRRVRVAFASEAEERVLPVALASMAAKLVRELAMARFNAHWSSRIAELKPTAGYVTDARRWLADVRASGAATEDELRAMCRRA